MFIRLLQKIYDPFLGRFIIGFSLVTEAAVSSVLRLLFRALQISYKIESPQTEEGQEGEASDRGYTFRFQGGNFHLVHKRQQSTIRILFLYFLDVPFSALDNVRYACNEFNQQAGDYKAFYSLKENDQSIAIHLLTPFRLSRFDAALVRDFSTTLSNCFDATRLFKDIFDSIQEQNSSDLEAHNAMIAREIYLAREAELINQNGGYQWRTNEVEHHYLEQLFYTLCSTNEVHFHRLRIVTNELIEINDPEEIALYDVTASIIRHDSEGALFVCESTTLIVEATVAGEQAKEYLLHLHAEDELEDVLYMRLTFVPPTSNFSTSHSRMTADLSPLKQPSFLIAYDTSTTPQRQSEFDYLWKEMNHRVDKGEPLSEEQQFMAFCTWPNTSYNLYWGRRLFQAERYYDALRHLENAYVALNHHYHGLRKSERENFFQIAYYIGFCYAQLGLYRQAYYYLDIVFPQNEYLYTAEYINALTNSGDFRALAIINNLMQTLSSNLENEENEDNSETITQAQRFLLFLKRRKSFVLLNMRQLDEAELLLKELLNDPESENFALQQLLRIQELREQQTSALGTDDEAAL